MTADLTDVIERTLREHAEFVSDGPGTGWRCRGCKAPLPFDRVVGGCRARETQLDRALLLHAAEAVTAAITEHAEVEEEWGVQHAGLRDVFQVSRPMKPGALRGARSVSRTIIRFPWKDVSTDEH